MTLDLKRWTGKGRILEIIEQDLANALHTIAELEQALVAKEQIIANLTERVNATAVTDGQAAPAAEPTPPAPATAGLETPEH